MNSELNLIPYFQFKPPNTDNYLKNLPVEHIQRVLLVAAVACSIISLIPNLGLIGGVSLRGIGGGAIALQVAVSLKNREGEWPLGLKIMRLAGSLIGIAAVASSFTPFAITALAVELAYQAGETGQGTSKRDPYKAFSHLSLIVIDAFALVGLMRGAWPYIVTAASLNSLAMLVFAVKAIVDGMKNKDPNYAIDAACYLIYGGISIGAAVRSTGISSSTAIKEFPTLPLESLTLVSEEPKLKKKEKIEETPSKEKPNEALQGFLNPQLNPPIKCFSFGKEEAVLTLLLDGAENGCKLDKEKACKISDYLNGAVKRDQDTFVLTGLDRKTFMRLSHFLQTGEPERLDRLKERELLALFNAADYLQVQNLRLLCLKETATRLQNREWKNISLFNPYYDSVNSLTPLIELFDFKRRES